MSEITCYFSPQSGFAYLGHARLRKLAAEKGVLVRWRPVDIVKVFAANEVTAPAKQSAARLAYRRMDMARTALAYNLPLNPIPPFWPTNTLPACRMIVALEATGVDPADYIEAVFRALWSRDLDISSEETLIAIAGETGLDGAALAARAAQDQSAATVETYTAEAIAAGVFGSPTYAVEGELFFGQDRLDLLAKRLGAGA
jgi:2-hydroxychromene-2-carboxylate isomerase